ncbi:hypothetical protein JI749_10210 [Devosia oryziradicis]|uniref:Integrase catalytic domain-containing protein n=1 Tax=Devosia oryziradicis TaxID=2801335 RepID=A0ABX7BS39_9HYPH|nr:hypothetical protein [Devosia oryziradicis]QQR34760.1 hypothetical protein JI749_10210 [Devosia oryziradicis]
MSEEDPDDIPPTARLFWMAHHFRISETYTDRYALECLDGYEYPRTLYRNKVRNLKLSGDLVVEPHYFDVDGTPARPGGHVHLLAGKSPTDLRRTMIAFTKASLFNRDYKAGKVVLYRSPGLEKKTPRHRNYKAVTADVWLAENAARIHEACRPFYVLDPKTVQGHSKPRLGQFPLRSLGSDATLKKDRQKLARKDFKITDLCPRTDDMRRGGRKMAPDMAAFIDLQIRKLLLRPERPTLALLRRQLRAEMRIIPSLAGRTTPSVDAIERLIGTLHDGQAIAARFGEKVAIESRTIFTEGPQYNYPGELVLMDCWKMDLVAKITDQGGWIFVRDSQIEEFGVRRRLWVAWVIDACSRAILGLALGLSESSDLTTRALRMAVTEKTLQSMDAGCEADPIPPIGLDGLLTDIGGAFTHPYFMVPALSLVDDADVGPGDSAHLRGLLERFNRTVKDQLLSYFTGTTFGNVIAKGDYDALDRASADVETLGRALWLYINDVYNLSPHRGNDGQPPIDRFQERFLSQGAADVYTEESVRLAFGLEFLLPLTGQGVCFASNHYVSGRLQTYFSEMGRLKKGRPRKLRAKVDLSNLGRISVYFEDDWHTLAGPARVRGVGFTDWINERRRLSKLYGSQAAANAHIVDSALRKLERMGTNARLRSQVKDMSYNAEEVMQIVNRTKLHIKEDEVATNQGQILAFDSSTREAAFQTSGTDPDDDDIEMVDDPYVDAGDDQRAETDLGLDDADIDKDGDLLEEPEEDIVDPGETDDEPKATPPSKTGAVKAFAFLPQPTRKSGS